MSTTMETLYELQGLLLFSKASAATRESQARELRAAIPPPILAHFDRLIAQGRKGVALVRRGVCGECHLRVSAATAASLVRPDDIYLCENCGCYLMLAPDESTAPVPPAAPAKAPAKAPGRPARKKPVATAA
jgi:hypothetical protein